MKVGDIRKLINVLADDALIMLCYNDTGDFEGRVDVQLCGVARRGERLSIELHVASFDSDDLLDEEDEE